MVFTEEDQANYWSEKTCHIIEDEFIQGDKNYCKVRDHCHSMGKYWGAAHSVCNLYCKENSFILAYNAPTFVNHLMLRKIEKKRKKKKKTSENCEKFRFFLARKDFDYWLTT